MSDKSPSPWSLKGLRDAVSTRMSDISLPSLPTLGSEVALAVYVIHNAPDPENYFFIFDFEEFVEVSKSGVFVRPKLKVWAGRADFAKRRFAREFRKSFAHEFDIARAQLAHREATKTGWFGFLRNRSLGQFAANVVLLAGVGAGKLVLSSILPKGWWAGKSDERALEESIADVQGKVDNALESLEIVLHPELYSHAFKGQPPGRLSGMDYDAWPLPDYVRAHLGDGTSGAWW